MIQNLKAPSEIDLFAQEIDDFRAGAIPEDEFRAIRLRMGIYGQRQPGFQMVRVKIPWGGLNPEQLHKLADLVTRYSTGYGHVTTRQDLQFHFVRLQKVPEILRELDGAGLTTREACGNTVRNVTACHLAGIAKDEVFDVTPIAAAVSGHFLRNPLAQSLPRKFKIAFDGCPGGACAAPNIHDIGGVAALRDGRRGFRLFVGGGLGNTPKPARLLEEWTPEEDVVRTAHAILEVFNRDGERKNRNRARLKFLVEKIGWEEFLRRVLETREAIPPGLGQERLEAARRSTDESEPVTLSWPHPAPDDPAYASWKFLNVVPQRQPGFSAVHVLLPIGDVRAAQLHGIAKAAALHGDGHVRATRWQNLLLRWVRNENLPALWTKLRELGLAEPGAQGLGDITSCPGADTCNLGITSSRGLARALRTLALETPEAFAAARDLQVKISGCPNSCGQHHIADLGFFGNAKKIGDRDVPTYQVLVGGGSGPGDEFGRAILKVPAKRAPDVFRRVVELFTRERAAGERFRDYARRAGAERFREALAEFEAPDTDDPAVFVDWAQSTEFRAPRAMKGECAQ
jgi:sulfite reductase beta subunit-like hemoprotein